MSNINDDSPADLSVLRAEVRRFLDDAIATGRFTPTADSWHVGWDAEFSQDLARQGWVGMTLPREFGGRGRSFIERWVVTDELLAVGAPVAAHWIADRQSAPTLLKFGSRFLQERFVPGIAAGITSFAIGMSEPESGSDLASVHTRGRRVEGGWIISGTKVWTTGAHKSDAMIALVRTSPLDTKHRHDGLSQFVIELDSPGVEIMPILSGNGLHHFNQIVLDDVFVSEENLVGQEGNGWSQVGSELSYERSGPERIMSSFVPFAMVTSELPVGDLVGSGIGRYVARLAAVHNMSFGIAQRLADGEDVAVQAAIVKRLGTTLEGDIIEFLDTEFAGVVGPAVRKQIELGMAERPNFTIRGGTNEILASVITKSLLSTHPSAQGRAAVPRYDQVSDDVLQLFNEALPEIDYSEIAHLARDTAGTTAAVADSMIDATLRETWELLEELGLDRLSTPAEDGGSGGSLADAAALSGFLAARGLNVPAGYNDVVAGAADRELVALGERVVGSAEAVTTFGFARAGMATVRFPSAGIATSALALTNEGTWRLSRIALSDKDRAAAAPRYGHDRVFELSAAAVSCRALATHEVTPELAAGLVLRSEVIRLFEALGAADRAATLTLSHVVVRTQFGRALSKFQAAQALIADVFSQAELVRSVVESALVAVGEFGYRGAAFEIAVARSAIGRATEHLVRSSHQAHGAIGTTLEYPLHAVTGKLLDLRAQGITVPEWESLLTRVVTERELRDVLAPGAATRESVVRHFSTLISR